MIASARNTLGLFALLTGVVLANCGNARGDGGTLRLCEVAGPYRISAFTSPSPPRAGQLDVSVLVQDAATGAILPDVDVMVRVASADPSLADQSHATRSIVATQHAAPNKLLRAAACQLPAAGEWRIEVLVHEPRLANSTGETLAAFDVVAGEPLPAWWDMAPWIGWPLAVVGLFAVHQALAARHSARRLSPHRAAAAPQK